MRPPLEISFVIMMTPTASPASSPPHLGHLQQVAVDDLLDASQALLFKEVMGTQRREVVIRVDVVQRENEVDEGLPAVWKAMRNGRVSISSDLSSVGASA